MKTTRLLVVLSQQKVKCLCWMESHEINSFVMIWLMTPLMMLRGLWNMHLLLVKFLPAPVNANRRKRMEQPVLMKLESSLLHTVFVVHSHTSMALSNATSETKTMVHAHPNLQQPQQQTYIKMMGTHTLKVTNNISRSNGFHFKLLDEHCLERSFAHKHGLEITPTGRIFLLVGKSKHTIELNHLIQDSVKWKGQQRAREFASLWTQNSFFSSSLTTVINIVREKYRHHARCPCWGGAFGGWK